MIMNEEFDRRRLLAGAAGIAGAAALGRSLPASAAAPLPDPSTSGIDHIILVMMENRSFDHFLGWLPGADGKQAGLTYVDQAGESHRAQHLRDYQGCAHPDPDHSYEGGRVELNGGRCDGWLRAGANDEYAICYYTAADQQLYGRAARYWTSFDRYFSATMAETYPNRFYQHSAQTDRIHNSNAIATMPTIWDRLADAGVSHAYYYYDVPFLALYGTKYLPTSRTYPQFLADTAAGTLPAVSFVDPKFLDEGSGTSADDHPHADIRAGQYFVNQVYEAVASGPCGRAPRWSSTTTSGAASSNVEPDTAPDPRPDLDTGLRGFRTPCLLMSPRGRRRYVSHGVYDHTSVLKMIEWRWTLPPLTVRDAAAGNLAEALDFTRVRTSPRSDGMCRPSPAHPVRQASTSTTRTGSSSPHSPRRRAGGSAAEWRPTFVRPAAVYVSSLGRSRRRSSSLPVR